jgi:hypothetical protein
LGSRHNSVGFSVGFSVGPLARLQGLQTTKGYTGKTDWNSLKSLVKVPSTYAPRGFARFGTLFRKRGT